MKYRFDAFGVLVLAFATGNAGGIARDLLIGATPPAAIMHLSYLGVSILAGLMVFFWDPVAERHNKCGAVVRCRAFGVLRGSRR